MKTTEIEAAVREIRELSTDAHSAHVKQDILYLRFIEYISTLDPLLSIKAKLVLETKKIEFERYYS